jgi:hypothetical protein
MNPRIVEKELRIEQENEPLIVTDIGGIMIDDNIYSIDDTLKVKFDLVFQEEKKACEDWITILEVYVSSISGAIKILLYKRSLREYGISGIFRRYRVPFNVFERAVDTKKNEDFKWYDGNKTDISKGIFDGNPKMKLEKSQTLVVSILSPLKIDKLKSKITLELIENRSHPTDKEVKVM